MSPQAVNLLVFREGRSLSSSLELKTALAQQLANLRDEPSMIRALLRAGELECGADDSGVSTNLLSRLTDSLAEALVHRRFELYPD